LFPPNRRYALLVALTRFPDLFVHAKDLFVEATQHIGAEDFSPGNGSAE
jgi:hypothetical protein